MTWRGRLWLRCRRFRFRRSRRIRSVMRLSMTKGGVSTPGSDARYGPGGPACRGLQGAPRRRCVAPGPVDEGQCLIGFFRGVGTQEGPEALPVGNAAVLRPLVERDRVDVHPGPVRWQWTGTEHRS